MAETKVQRMAVGAKEAAASPVPVPALAAPGPRPMEEHAAWPMLSRLPVMLAVSVPLKGLKVRRLLELRAGDSVRSAWAVTEDVPLRVGDRQLCWGEFEVVEEHIALRLTRLA